ncbi:hypothetical protein AB204_18065 [Xenorhabdus khoisanae]|uniref:Uncharacterized protein n=1 Tax=Xenorhabdus khoisanae TaxID=880157 RepID=A0A0J5IKN3_9GAMM|nr:hypothetical protein [Xenorhabdus khoisanae]KMJ43735.1 hypothetical protein AB204_18065 [Xenorhabdus khoisanae]
MITKNHPDHFMPQKLFNNIKELLNKYNINSIRLCCCYLCYLGETGFAQKFANLTQKPVKASMGKLIGTKANYSDLLLNHRMLFLKKPQHPIQVDNNRHHDIDVTSNRFIWFYPQNM